MGVRLHVPGEIICGKGSLKAEEQISRWLEQQMLFRAERSNTYVSTKLILATKIYVVITMIAINISQHSHYTSKMLQSSYLTLNAASSMNQILYCSLLPSYNDSSYHYRGLEWRYKLETNMMNMEVTMLGCLSEEQFLSPVLQ